MPAGVYGTGLRRADTVRDGLAIIAAEGKNKVRKRLVSGLYFYNTEETQTRNFASPSTSGMVTTDKIQKVFLSSSQTVNKVWVAEGDSVRKGDKLISYDSTLTQDAVELLTSPFELAGYKEAIMEAMYKGTKRNIESEMDSKNAQVG